MNESGPTPSDLWTPGAPGVLGLPSGRLIRGRSLRKGIPPGLEPDFGLYLLGRQPPVTSWGGRWIRWPDFRLPSDREDARRALQEAWTRADHQRVEVACAGGRGRTGTALACLAILDGVHPDAAVAYVRERYSPKAVETPWQRKYVEAFI